VPLETLVQKFAYMRFEPEGITQNPEIPFAKSMPDYIMRWLASRFLDAESQEELGILTPEVRAKKAAEDAVLSVASSDTAGPAVESSKPAGPASVAATVAPADPAPAAGAPGAAGAAGSGAQGTLPVAGAPAPAGPAAASSRPAASVFTDLPPVVPAVTRRTPLGLDLGPACSQCGGMMQRTGSCYTCSSCGNNTGCG
jgi:ribonucleoside-diphosphate reductase alpha chain